MKLWSVTSRVGVVDRNPTGPSRRRRCADDPRLRVAVADVDVAARSRSNHLQPPRLAVRQYNRHQLSLSISWLDTYSSNNQAVEMGFKDLDDLRF